MDAMRGMRKDMEAVMHTEYLPLNPLSRGDVDQQYRPREVRS